MKYFNLINMWFIILKLSNLIVVADSDSDHFFYLHIVSALAFLRLIYNWSFIVFIPSFHKSHLVLLRIIGIFASAACYANS